MRDALHLFSLKERIFLVKTFYKSESDLKGVRSKYLLEYGRSNNLPTDSLILGAINLFETTGSVREIPGDDNDDNTVSTLSANSPVAPDDGGLLTEIKVEEPEIEEATEFLEFVPDFPKVAPKKRGNDSKSNSEYEKKIKIESNCTFDYEIQVLPADPLEIIEKDKTVNDHFGVTQLRIKFLVERPVGARGFEWLNEAFNQIIKLIKSEGKPGDKALLDLHIPHKPEIKPVCVNLTAIDRFSPDDLLDKIKEVNQSEITDEFQITVSIIHMMAGTGRNSVANMDPDDIKKYKKYSVIDPNIKEFCLPIALLFGKLLHLTNDENRKKALRSRTRYKTKLLMEAKTLIKECGETITNDGQYDLSFISRFNARHPEYLVTVFDKLDDCKSIPYRSTRTSLNAKNRINLFFNAKSNHYFCISRLPAFFNYRRMCEDCGTLYNHNHPRCSNRCPHCNSAPPCAFSKVLKNCPDCKRHFRGETCYENHKLLLCNPVYNTIEICNTCDAIQEVGSDHTCKESKCFNCNKMVKQPHCCYIQKYLSDPPERFQIIFYNFQRRLLDQEQGYNSCITNIVCHECYKSSTFPTNCLNCHPFERIFDFENCIEDFTDYVLQFQAWPVVAIAHNVTDDIQAILNELNRREIEASPTWQGQKILSISTENVTFLDSIAFIPMTLSKFSTTFDLNDYKADVHILRDGCLKFMTSLLETGQVNPYLQATTIEDVAMKVYRKGYLKEKSLGVTLDIPVSTRRQVSKIGQKWLISQKEAYFHNMTFNEKIEDSNYIVDGFDESSRTIFEFFECFHHGHTCLPDRKYQCSEDPLDTLENRYIMLTHRCKKLHHLGYKVKSVWECEFRKTIKSDPNLNTFIKTNQDIIEASLDLGSAVYGGRSDVFRKYCKTQPGDKIYFYKFNSSYLWAMKYSKYFLGYPKIIQGFASPIDILKYDGVAKCKILPPQGLQLPVLPYRCNNRLSFPLCAVCALEQSKRQECRHSKDQRTLLGCWSVDEIRLAIEHGYIILETLELWSFETIQYDRNTGETGLFADYLDHYIKVMQEADGWPDDCKSKDLREHYIEKIFQNEKVRLDKQKIIANKGLRSSAELMLNTLWKKFNQRDDSKITVYNSREELISIASNEGIEVHQLGLCSPDKIFVNWSNSAESLPQTPDINLGVEICTRTNARIALYGILSVLEKNILYCDEDSFIFLVASGEENPLTTGSFLGELTDELGEGVYIDEFVSAEPKSYGLRIFDPATSSYHYKVVYKGIRMNEEEMEFDALKEVVKV